MAPYPRNEDGFRSAWQSARAHCRMHPQTPIWLYVPADGSGYVVSIIEPHEIAPGTVARQLTPQDFEGDHA